LALHDGEIEAQKGYFAKATQQLNRAAKIPGDSSIFHD
jgi:hypothetical protein